MNNRFEDEQGLLQEDKAPRQTNVEIHEHRQRKALLVGFTEQKDDLLTGVESLRELQELADTAGIMVTDSLMVKISKPDPRTYLRSGKIQEIALLTEQQNIDLVLTDTFLSPRQQQNLSEALNCEVADRTALILEIFAQRARTKEGKLQVELAQLNYLLPRLSGRGREMSRLGAGIGTRGPGETKLEADRRRIRQRIGELGQEIEEIKKQRAVLRQKREHNEIPVVALVGYTNAGKSTLLNRLTQADVLTEDKLFATLDPTTRRLKYAQQEMLFTDTVGFIHKLPHQLVSAFRATLEEITYADLLLHVVDAGASAYEAHIQAVRQVLESIGTKEKRCILVLNKQDTVTDPIELANTLQKNRPALAISALQGDNMDELLELVVENLPKQYTNVTLSIPYGQSALVNSLFEKAQVYRIEYQDENILCSACLSEQLMATVRPYILEGSSNESRREDD